MKKLLTRILPLTLVAALFSSCQTYGPNANARAVLGGVLGAGLGAVVGEHKGRELEGAAIGGVIGTIAGGAVGTAQDQVNGTVPYTRTSHPYPSTYQRPVVYSDPYYGRPVYRSYPTSSISIGGVFGSRGYSRGYSGHGRSRGCYHPPQVCY